MKAWMQSYVRNKSISTFNIMNEEEESGKRKAERIREVVSRKWAKKEEKTVRDKQNKKKRGR